LTELYFAGASKTGKPGNRDIFISVKQKGKWSDPVPLGKSVNTEYYESHPAISPDGSMLVFSSDRPGGLGQTDLYISRRQDDGRWSEAESPGNLINTASFEISPFISKDNRLYYASKGFSGNFDIIQAFPNSAGGWIDPVPLTAPLNTTSDETGPTIYANYFFVSSNRFGGCGGFDLYNFPLCGPVYITGTVFAEGSVYSQRGQIILMDSTGNVVNETFVSPLESYWFPAQPENTYFVKYTNPCLPGSNYEMKVKTACSDTSTLKYIVDFKLPTPEEEMIFNEKSIPYFVSGYYRPNTRENLSDLRLKFAYNLYGVSDSTKYIESPGTEYDAYSETVETQLNMTVDFILDKLNYLSGECVEGENNIRIIIMGFADKRRFSATAVYADDSIEDEEFGISVANGEKMTNDLLSRLRAYFTAKYFESVLTRSKVYNKLRDRITWDIEGKGIDQSDNLTDIEKRRVNVRVTSEQPE
jgi:hypothetical protein